jgi:flagellar basal body-associated protein FliL
MNQTQQPVSSSQGGAMEPSQPAMAPWLMWTFIIVLIAGAGYFAWFFFGQKNTTATNEVVPTSVVTKKVTPTVTVTPNTGISPTVSVTVTPKVTPSVSVTVSPSL